VTAADTAKKTAAKLTGAQRYNLANWTTGQTPTLTQALGFTTAPKGTGLTPQLSLGTSGQLGNTTTSASNTSSAGAPTAKDEAANAALGQKMAAAQPYNWTGAQWTALNNIVMAESGWNATIKNPSSDAYGIPQALPGSKMASAGADWQTDPATQIAWMLEYIRSRYGTPVRAWQWHLAHGWY
jgi:resuscitation-promoting factor RpfB